MTLDYTEETGDKVSPSRRTTGLSKRWPLLLGPLYLVLKMEFQPLITTCRTPIPVTNTSKKQSPGLII